MTERMLGNGRIKLARERAAKADLALRLAIWKAVTGCKHLALAEAPGRPSRSHASLDLPGCKICMRCGLAEEKGGSGMALLWRSKRVAEISGEDLKRLATVIVADSEKGPLLRLEVKTADFLARKLGLRVRSEL